MPIVSGERFGAFEVIERLGAGGMGEVYRARDTRLDRTVALKVIRAAHLGGPHHLDRFRREARAISRLNHPHICALYDIGEQNGEAFLVMEYVPGETLAARIERAPLRIEEALRYGAQIAEALEAAHRQGVVHRDLKPSNIMLSRDGVKLLDFGLAKLRDVEANDAGTASTMSVALSQDGLILGSLPYMAPEQLEGRPVDGRADLFALGAILYEMVTGERPFHGDSKASLIVAILSHEPVSPAARQPLTPPLLDRTITRCLAKSPDDRWQTALDLADELRYLRDAVRESPPDHSALPRRRRRSHIALLGVALATAVTLMALAFTAMRSSAALPSFERLTYRRGIITAARVFPQAQTVVYSAAWEGQPYDLYLTQTGSHDSRSVGLRDARVLAISDTGEIAFIRGPQSVFRAFGTLARLPLTGGQPRELLEHVAAADWMPGGGLAVIRYADNSGRIQIEFPIGTKIYESQTRLGSLRVSADGSRVAFLEGNIPTSICVLDRAGHKQVLAQGFTPALGLAWSPDGREIWFSGSRGTAPALRAVTLNGKERLLAEAPDALRIQDVLPDGRVLAVRDLGREGFACRTGQESADRDLSWFDGSSLEALSPDGRVALFGETRGGGGQAQGIYLRTTDGGAAVRLGDGYPEDLSPDGRWVLTRPRDETHGWGLLPVGVGVARWIPRSRLIALFEANFLPDGKSVVFGGREEGQQRRIYVQDLDGGQPRAISPEGVRTIGLSTPDGKFVAGATANGHVLFSTDGTKSRPLPFLSSEDWPIQWTSDGRFLYVVHAAPWVDTAAQIYQTIEARIDRVDVGSGQRTEWKTLMTTDRVGFETISDVYVTPDGSGYCYGYARTLSDLFVVSHVK
jgi:eukaryotic-like serine/threonine-protein kinase